MPLLSQLGFFVQAVAYWLGHQAFVENFPRPPVVGVHPVFPFGIGGENGVQLAGGGSHIGRYAVFGLPLVATDFLPALAAQIGMTAEAVVGFVRKHDFSVLLPQFGFTTNKIARQDFDIVAVEQVAVELAFVML